MARHFANALGFVLDAENQRVGSSNWFKVIGDGDLAHAGYVALLMLISHVVATVDKFPGILLSR